MDEDFVKYIRQLRTVNEEQVRRQHEQKLQEERTKTATQAECERLRKGYNLDWLSRLEDRNKARHVLEFMDKPNDISEFIENLETLGRLENHLDDLGFEAILRTVGKELGQECSIARFRWCYGYRGYYGDWHGRGWLQAIAGLSIEYKVQEESRSEIYAYSEVSSTPTRTYESHWYDRSYGVTAFVFKLFDDYGLEPITPPLINVNILSEPRPNFAHTPIADHSWSSPELSDFTVSRHSEIEKGFLRPKREKVVLLFGRARRGSLVFSPATPDSYRMWLKEQLRDFVQGFYGRKVQKD